MATPATMVSTTIAGIRKISTMKCGIRRNHLTSQSQRLGVAAGVPSIRSGEDSGPSGGGGGGGAGSHPALDAPAADVGPEWSNRAPATSNRAATNRATPPAISSPSERPKSIGAVAPTAPSQLTAGVAPAFISTMAHCPEAAFHASVSVPAPDARATQND